MLHLCKRVLVEVGRKMFCRIGVAGEAHPVFVYPLAHRAQRLIEVGVCLTSVLESADDVLASLTFTFPRPLTVPTFLLALTLALCRLGLATIRPALGDDDTRDTSYNGAEHSQYCDDKGASCFPRVLPIPIVGGQRARSYEFLVRTGSADSFASGNWSRHRDVITCLRAARVGPRRA
jgi:hypothetical protein